ncbi:hypothetical protein JOF56_005209 [Kibdelosporangium banguiense]|uniref:AAA+ ATPase domain-containing protein n=1 Tax=Kibdelosporangium banguiense TaxID=1365924 RepID=A0ABS4TKH5_9PSEU|nr:ATP-binding protein [Kibdelosporangium banguiense]MBP2324824.1 hypothetical protein [Kibdelosporangium banguiense]
MTGSEVLTALVDVELRVRQAIQARRAGDPMPDDPYRGLYLTAEAVDRILAGNPVMPPWNEPGPLLGKLAEDFGLTPLDVRFLLIALAPDVDPRFERLYAYLNDDMTRRRATIGLVLDLCGLQAAGAARFRLAPNSPLVSGGLIDILEQDSPALARGLRVPDRVVAYLLGDNELDSSIVDFCRIRTVASDDPVVAKLGAGVKAGVRLLYLRGGERLAVPVLTAAGCPSLVLDPLRLGDALAAVVREARLRGAGIVLGPVDSLGEKKVLRELVARTSDVPLILYGQRSWDPLWGERTPVSRTVEPADAAQRKAEWGAALAGSAGEITSEPGPYRLGPEQIQRAASVAAQNAMLDARPISAGDIRAGVRAQNAAGLDKLARRIEPSVGWSDLVLPEQTRDQLAELVVRARHRDHVLGTWRMRPGGGRGRGVTALFAGESGTGKTMSAEVVAAELGMDLYVVDLSTVVDKYVGETEKNLERVFAEAAAVQGVLLFDEADAIFGKRSQVKDAHDRYANLESAFLLQRMESFDGIAVLTTNLRANLDEAFTRRLDVIADFPVPDEANRLALWDRCLGTALPRADDLDLAFCAEKFELTGGSIRACAVTAAYLAADTGCPVGTVELITAIRQEYRKLGRLLLDSEFAPFH